MIEENEEKGNKPVKSLLQKTTAKQAEKTRPAALQPLTTVKVPNTLKLFEIRRHQHLANCYKNKATNDIDVDFYMSLSRRRLQPIPNEDLNPDSRHPKSLDIFDVHMYLGPKGKTRRIILAEQSQIYAEQNM